MQTTKTNYTALMTLATVFFFWGFVAASNDILIPVFKKQLHLSQGKVQLISFAFYIAYTVGSLIYFGVSMIRKKDILASLGYKNGIALGLVISAIGTLLFIPAANTQSFELMISGLFIVGLGFSLQQTAANPLTINIGDPSTGSQRLSLTGGINNIGTTIGPVLVSLAIFGDVSGDSSTIQIENIKVPYLILGAAFILVAVLLKFSSIPNHLPTVESETTSVKKSAIRFPQLWLGMIAIFVYVGVEVSTAGNLSEYLKQTMGLKENQVAPYVSLFWASLMIGRWTSAASVFTKKSLNKRILGVILPYAAFGVFILVNLWVKNDIRPFKFYGFVIAIMIVLEFLSKGNPSRQLLIFSLAGIVSLLIGMFGSGMTSVYAFIAVGLFCSTLWPCIFTLAINKLGASTTQGSGLLIMMIMGGGIVSIIQGGLAENPAIGIQMSYVVGIVCFAYLAFYAYIAPRITK